MLENELKSDTDTKSFDALKRGLFGYFDFTDRSEYDLENSYHTFLKVLLEVGKPDAISLSRNLRREWNSIAKKLGASPSFLSKETLPEEEYDLLHLMEVKPIETEDREKPYNAEARSGKPVESHYPQKGYNPYTSYHPKDSRKPHGQTASHYPKGGSRKYESASYYPKDSHKHESTSHFSKGGSRKHEPTSYHSQSSHDVYHSDSNQQRKSHGLQPRLQHPSNQPHQRERFQKSSEVENITAQAFKSQYNEIVQILQEKQLTVQFANMLCAFKIIPPSIREQFSLLQDKSLIQTKAIVGEVRVVVERAVEPARQMKRVIDVLRDPVFRDHFKCVIEYIENIIQLPEEGQGQINNPPSAAATKPVQSTHDLSQEPYKVYNQSNLPVDLYKRRLYLQYQNNLPSNDIISFDSNSWKYYNLVTNTQSASQTRESGGALNLHCIPLELGNRYPPRTLIMGPPGVGKSSIVAELCKRWYSQQLLCKYEYVILLKADDPPVDSLKDLIREDHDAAIHSIEAAEGKNTLFIIDGYDEFSRKQRKKNSFYDRIIQGKLICEAAVIVTARPWCAKQLSNRFDTIEIQGLTHESRNEYISQSGLVSNSAKIRSCFPKSLEACTSNPLYLATLVKMFSSDNNDGMIRKPALDSFISITKLYGLLVQTLIFDFADKSENKLRNALISFHPVAECDFSGLPRDIYIPFLKLCILSYKSFFTDEVSHLELTVEPDAEPTFNLLMKLEGTQLNGRARFIFRHSSIQEFLAAYCISRMKEEDKAQSLQSLQRYSRPQYISVVEFLYGLGCIKNTKLKDDRPLTRFDSLRQLCEAVNSFDLIKDVYQSKACEQSNVIICRTWPLPHPYDLMCLGRVIALSNRSWELGFTYRPLHDEHLEMLCEGIKSVDTPPSQLGRIKQIKLSLTRITEKSISHLGEIPEQCLESTEEIQLCGIGLTSTAQLRILLPRLSGLQKLFLHNNKFEHNERMELLKKLIYYCDKLTCISFSDLDPEECAMLLQYPSLETVELWRMSTDSCRTVIENLATDDRVQTASKLNTLEIYQSEITPTSISSLPITLPRSKIGHLKLSNCNINCETTEIITTAARLSAGKLHSLDLSDNDIKDKGGEKLLEQHVLKVYNCEITCTYNRFSESMRERLKQKGIKVED